MKIKEKALLVVCGALLMLTQYVAVREIGSTFFSTEIVTMLSVVMVLIGPSLAYYYSDRIGDRFLLLWSALSFFSLIMLPFAIRYLVSIMKLFHLELFAMLVVLLLGSLFFSSFFAVFLPRLAKTTEDFRVLYALELTGSILSLFLLWLVPGWNWLIACYWLLIVLCLHLAFGRLLVTGFTLLVVVAGVVFYGQLDNMAAKLYYQVYWDKENPEILETHYSPYQRVDVVKADDGKGLYLDGVPYYESGDLQWFNYYIAELPGRMLKKKDRALVIGAGTLSSTGYLVKQGYSVTTVDIDSVVADMGMKHFSDINQLTRDDFSFQIADARRYIRTVPDASFDLIVLDIPAPYHIQTALLYIPSFLKELKRCLRPGGIVAVNTCSYRMDDPISKSIAASCTSVFEDVYAIAGDSLGLTILYCSDKLPFEMETLKREVKKSEKDRILISDNNSVRFNVGQTKPHSEENLAALMLLSRYEFPELKKWLAD